MTKKILSNKTFKYSALLYFGIGLKMFDPVWDGITFIFLLSFCLQTNLILK